MIYPRHIPLTERKSLCARLIYLDSLNRIGAAPPSTSSYNTFRRLLLEHLALPALADKKQREDESRASAPPKPLEALDLSLREAINSFKKAPAYSLLTGDLHSKTLMKLVTLSLNSLSCLKCTSQGPICDGLGQMKDSSIVHHKGSCITQLREMFELARDAAQCYYAAYASNFPSDPLPDIVFSTGLATIVPESAHRLQDFYAGAVTDFTDEPGQPRAETKLILVMAGDRFLLDSYTYEGILYVMFHECISHAFHGLLPTFQDRKTSYPFDAFSEGFMDQVAYDILTEAVEDEGLAKSLELKKRIAFSEPLKATATMYRERNLCTVDDIASNNANIALGVEAAKTSENLIEKAYKSEEFGPVDDFKRAFYRLAFDLNTSRDVDRTQRSDFVILMYNYHLLSAIRFEDREHEDNLWLLDIERTIAQYLRTGHISELVRQAKTLAPP